MHHGRIRLQLGHEVVYPAGDGGDVAGEPGVAVGEQGDVDAGAGPVRPGAVADPGQQLLLGDLGQAARAVEFGVVGAPGLGDDLLELVRRGRRMPAQPANDGSVSTGSGGPPTRSAT